MWILENSKWIFWKHDNKRSEHFEGNNGRANDLRENFEKFKTQTCDKLIEFVGIH
jgi:hypothetical protein